MAQADVRLCVGETRTAADMDTDTDTDKDTATGADTGNKHSIKDTDRHKRGHRL